MTQHATVRSLRSQMRLPIIAAPMFIVSGPALVIAQCCAGIVGSFPALNARPQEKLGEWLEEINTALSHAKAQGNKTVAPFAVNQIIHPSNTRLMADMMACKAHQVPLLITSLSAPDEIVKEAHGWGAKVFHDVISVRHAKKALAAGVDGLILVCAGAGGHAGALSPFALVSEIRSFYDGPLILSGAMSSGASVLAAQAMGADFAYMGTRFICTTEANAPAAYQQAIVESTADDVVYTPYFTGVAGNYLKKSIVQSGLDPDNLPVVDKSKMNFGGGTKADGSDAKAWKDIWGAGQGVGTINATLSTVELVAQLEREYLQAKARLLE